MARSEIPFTVADSAGVGQVVSVTITVRGGGSATIFADEVGSATQSNPTFTDSSGRIRGWLEEGSYTLAFGAPLSYSRAIEINRGDGVSKVIDNIITTAKLADNAVSQSKFAASTIATAKLADNSITEPKLATGAFTSRTFAANAIATANILNGAVSTRTLVSTLTGTEIGSQAVGGSILVDSSVTAAKLADNAAITAKINDGAVTPEKLATSVVTGAKVAAGTIPLRAVSAIPIGLILPYAGSSVPSANWAFCDGAALSTTTYAALYQKIGTTYGSGAGVFNLPDLRGRAAYGHSPGGHTDVNTLGDNDGVASTSRYPQHGHSLGALSVGGGSHGHTIETGITGPKGSYNYPSSCYANFPRRYLGLYNESLSTFGEHGHSVGGTIGDTSGISDTGGYFVLNFIIRIQ